MSAPSMRSLVVALGLAVVHGCTCVTPSDELIYACESDGTCLEAGKVCVLGRCVPAPTAGGRAGGAAGGMAGGDAGGMAGGTAGGDDAGVAGGTNRSRFNRALTFVFLCSRIYRMIFAVSSGYDEPFARK